MPRSVSMSFALGAAALASVLACGGEPTDPPPLVDDAHFYVALALEHHAVTLALRPPADTARLTATALSGTGVPLASVHAVTYTTSDPLAVSVDPTGLLRAHEVAQGVLVVASAYDPVTNVTRADTAVVNVTADTASVVTFSIQPAPGDSAKVALFGDPCTQTREKTLNVQVAGAGGTLLPDVAVAFGTSDRTVAVVDPASRLVQPKRWGHVTFTATALAYGHALRDTLPFAIGYPVIKLVTTSQQTLAGSTTPINSFGQIPGGVPVDTVGVGAVIVWYNQWSQPMDVHLDTPSAAVATHGWPDGCGLYFYPTGAGDIPALASDPNNPTVSPFQVRQFDHAGTYDYHSTRYPAARGRIVVAAGPS